MSKTRTPFDILGVTPADDMATIRMAWRAKVRQLHPDVAGNTKGSNERLAEVNAAFDALQGHKPKLRAEAPKTSDAVRPVERARSEVRKQRAEARRKSDVEAARRAAQAAETAKAGAIRARLRDHMGTVYATAATGYAIARRILAA
jgi:curved DNA-binding protein CbpA